jgi:hypothetical protein
MHLKAEDEQAVFHSNKYAANTECENCKGIIRHEPWCIAENPNVLYAYEVVLHPNKLSVEDSMRLHGMGSIWDACKCKGVEI